MPLIKAEGLFIFLPFLIHFKYNLLKTLPVVTSTQRIWERKKGNWPRKEQNGELGRMSCSNFLPAVVYEFEFLNNWTVPAPLELIGRVCGLVNHEKMNGFQNRPGECLAQKAT